MRIREITAADRDSVARICRLTGRGGDDATGDYLDDDVLADVYATPYLEHPSGFGVVALGESGDVVGYLIGTTDTEGFARWFVSEWWPRVSGSKVPLTPADVSLFRGASDPDRMLVSHRARYPAHLHIDLLEEARGAGTGRRLVEAAVVVLRERGVTGVHLVVSASNDGAIAFYERTGFTALLDDVGTVPGDSIVYARDVSPGDAGSE
ncbi:acetyltransferase (GNAT) family protein [Labedella gwakjiensis]|uniref:Acetyltransferase (GNAT) family protein n=1 Tax=Labedella gwakjiensis TaxID=390269 RepID=A0A2P8GXF5_9MICO|nr:GNAT family N-acetyltransferase [Labedella gwakjiensis]PSL38648.1 acetyltransferase (GNAT) family protein [Labedella gwakjiensis]